MSSDSLAPANESSSSADGTKSRKGLRRGAVHAFTALAAGVFIAGMALIRESPVETWYVSTGPGADEGSSTSSLLTIFAIFGAFITFVAIALLTWALVDRKSFLRLSANRNVLEGMSGDRYRTAVISGAQVVWSVPILVLGASAIILVIQHSTAS